MRKDPGEEHFQTIVAVTAVLLIIGGVLFFQGGIRPLIPIDQHVGLQGDTTKSPVTDGTAVAPEPVVPKPDSNNLQAITPIATRTDPNVGSYITDVRGITLYTTTNAGCTGDCLTKWLPYIASGPFIVNNKFNFVPRADTGELQFTWNKQPLYYYVGDHAPGEINGQNSNGVWSVVKS